LGVVKAVGVEFTNGDRLGVKVAESYVTEIDGAKRGPLLTRAVQPPRKIT
jgi:hypothetical protein